MDSVDTKENSILIIPSGIDGLESIGDGTNRQLHPRAGVNPGHRKHSGLRRYSFGDVVHDFTDGLRRCVAVQHEYETDVAGRLVRSGWQGAAAQAALAVLDRHDDAFELDAIQHRSAAAALGTLHSRPQAL